MKIVSGNWIWSFMVSIENYLCDLFIFRCWSGVQVGAEVDEESNCEKIIIICLVTRHKPIKIEELSSVSLHVFMFYELWKQNLAIFYGFKEKLPDTAHQIIVITRIFFAWEQGCRYVILWCQGLEVAGLSYAGWKDEPRYTPSQLQKTRLVLPIHHQTNAQIETSNLIRSCFLEDVCNSRVTNSKYILFSVTKDSNLLELHRQHF